VVGERGGRQKGGDRGWECGSLLRWREWKACEEECGIGKSDLFAEYGRTVHETLMHP
jgi:hypothetical protein